MTSGLRILPAADADVDELATHIASTNLEQGLRFCDAVQSTYALILDGPERWGRYGFGSPRLAELRKRSVLGFPNHLVFYRIDADMVEIVRVLHGARDIPAVLEDMGSD
jgi:toxin ParE1/3/4